MGERVGHDVRSARLVLYYEIKSQELADPMVLWNSSQALVEDELQGLVIRADDEAATPKVWSLVAHRLRETNKFPLVSC